MDKNLINSAVSLVLEDQKSWPTGMYLFVPYTPEQIVLPENAFLMALMAYLELADLPYNTFYQISNKLLPLAKTPFINTGKFVLSDWKEIIKFAAGKGATVRQGFMNEREYDLMTGYISMVNKVLLNSERYLSWENEAFFQAVTKKRYSSAYRVGDSISMLKKRRDVRQQLKKDGWSVKSLEWVIQDINHCFKTLSQLLAEKPYFFGSKLTELDVLVYGHLHAILTPPYLDTVLAQKALCYPNLIQLCRRINNIILKKQEKANMSVLKKQIYKASFNKKLEIVLKTISEHNNKDANNFDIGLKTAITIPSTKNHKVNISHNIASGNSQSLNPNICLNNGGSVKMNGDRSVRSAKLPAKVLVTLKPNCGIKITRPVGKNCNSCVPTKLLHGINPNSLLKSSRPVEMPSDLCVPPIQVNILASNSNTNKNIVESVGNNGTPCVPPAKTHVLEPLVSQNNLNIAKSVGREVTTKTLKPLQPKRSLNIAERNGKSFVPLSNMQVKGLQVENNDNSCGRPAKVQILQQVISSTSLNIAKPVKINDDSCVPPAKTPVQILKTLSPNSSLNIAKSIGLNGCQSVPSATGAATVWKPLSRNISLDASESVEIYRDLRVSPGRFPVEISQTVNSNSSEHIAKSDGLIGCQSVPSAKGAAQILEPLNQNITANFVKPAEINENLRVPPDKKAEKTLQQLNPNYNLNIAESVGMNENSCVPENHLQQPLNSNINFDMVKPVEVTGEQNIPGDRIQVPQPSNPNSLNTDGVGMVNDKLSSEFSEFNNLSRYNQGNPYMPNVVMPEKFVLQPNLETSLGIPVEEMSWSDLDLGVDWEHEYLTFN